jgi:hypothetical protein
MWGYSGGSIPTQFAAQQQPHYAPELSHSLLGATAGGVIANLSATLLRIDNTKFAGLGLGGLKGFSQEYSDVHDYVEKHLVSDKKDDFHKAGTLCLEPLENKFSKVSIFSFLDNEHEILHSESLKPIFHDNIMGKQTPKIPQFLYHSIRDEISPIENVDLLVKKYCSDGGNIEFHKDLESEHAVLALTGSPDAISWIQDRFAGKEVKDGCPISTLVTSLESAGATEMLGKLVADNFQRVIDSKSRAAGSEFEKAEDKIQDKGEKIEDKFDDWF